MSIFNDTITLYKDFLKEGNVLLFDVDISHENENLRIIVRKIKYVEKFFNDQKIQINIFLSHFSDFNFLSEFISNSNDNNLLFVFYKKNGKLISFNFSNNYKIINFSKLDQLCKSKKIDYSIEIHKN